MYILKFNDSYSVIANQSSLVGVVQDPTGRGTASLLVSCLLTLVLCVWSALHLNVPGEAKYPLQWVWLNIRWILVGVYAPELVVFTAWRQWSSARILGKIIHTLYAPSKEKGSRPCDTFSDLTTKWSMTHSFFASTGGFAFDFSNDQEPSFLPEFAPKRLFITARGMALLARCGHLPEIGEADIKDKSKANNVAKALVMIQAAWMLVQVLGRLAAGLPVTLLEVNTIAHVMCAFLMYAMWWNKPLAPKEPFIFTGDWVKSLCAYMFICSEMSGQIDPDIIESQTIVKTLFASMRLFAKYPEVDSVCFMPANAGTFEPSHQEHDRDALVSNGKAPDELRQDPGSYISKRVAGFVQSDKHDLAPQPATDPCLNLLQKKNLEKAAGTAFFERKPRVKGTGADLAKASEESLARLNLAAQAIQTYPAILEQYVFLQHNEGTCFHFRGEEFLVNRVQNWPWDDLLRDVGGLIVGMILWLACFAYGAIHLAAWDDQFPTEIERWLWRTCSLYIAFCGGLWIVLNYVTQACKPLNAFWDRWMDGGGKWWQNALIGTPVVICGSSLIFARAFVVIEAFISIRQLPAAAYETPTWTQVIPHF